MGTTPNPVNYDPYPADSDDPEVIRARIEATRADMSQTVNTIQQRLSPERLTHEAKETIKEATIGKVEDMADNATRTANSMRRGLVRTIKDNPIPAALAGIGLAWLFMSGSDEQDDSGYEYRQYPTRNVYGQPRYTQIPHSQQGRIADTVTDVRDQAGEMVRQAKDQAGDVAGQVKDQAQDLAAQTQAQAHALTQQAQDQMDYYANRAQYQARRARRGFNHMLDENPMALGAMALAVGAAIGLSAPSTRREDEWMGETRDHLVNQAQSQARETMGKVQSIASEVADDVQKSAHDVIETTKEAAQSAKQTAKQEAKKQDLTN